MSDVKKDSFLSELRKKLEDNITKIENRTDLTDDEKVLKIIKLFSSGCAALAAQPLPFFDIYVLTPTQALMGSRIAAIRGIPVSQKNATEIIKEIIGVVFLGFLARHLVISAYKFIPYWGIITTIPVVFSMTYAMGRTMDSYFIQKKKNAVFNKEEINKIWKEMMKEGKDLGKKNKKEIWRFKDEYNSAKD